MRGQVPWTICNGARTNSGINNSQTSGYVMAPEYYAVLPREWRAGTTASSAKGGRSDTTAVEPGGSGGRPGTTAVVPTRHLLASHL